MNIDALLSPYRGFKPNDDLPAVAHPRGGMLTRPRTTSLRATRIDRGPDLPSPESWEMFEFVRSLTG